MGHRRFFVVQYGQIRDGGRDHIHHYDGSGAGFLTGARVAIDRRCGTVEGFVRFEVRPGPETTTTPLRVIETAWEQGLREEREDAARAEPCEAAA